MTVPSTATAAPGLLTGGFASLRIGRIEPLTSDSVAITLDGADAYRPAFEFRAGQHVTLRRDFEGQEIRRSYSICVQPGSGQPRIAVRRITGGLMSTWLTQRARVGDLVDVASPTGDFGRGIGEAPGSLIVLIGAGSGVTPLLSIAAAHLGADRRSAVLMVLGNRTSASVMLAEDLYDLKNRYPTRMHLVHVFSREEQAAPGLNGHLDPDRLTRILHGFHAHEAAAEWYLCGPMPVVDNARASLVGLGVSPAAVHSELFYAGTPDHPAEISRPVTESTVVATLNGRRTTVTTSETDQSILEVLLSARSDAPFACKSGVCGTCRARCVSGEVVMLVNYALEAPEIQAGVILTCQALPASSRVELEYLS